MPRWYALASVVLVLLCGVSGTARTALIAQAEPLPVAHAEGIEEVVSSTAEASRIRGGRYAGRWPARSIRAAGAFARALVVFPRRWLNASPPAWRGPPILLI